MSKFKIHLLLARRLSKDKEQNLSRPIIRLSEIGVALGIATIIIAMAITTGYKNVIRDKVIGMGSHIRISNYDNNYSFEPIPFERDQFFIPELRNNPEIENLQFFATKVGIIKMEDQVEGIVLKGIDSSFYWKYFQQNIIEGNRINTDSTVAGQDILISSNLSRKLKINTGDKIRTYFVQDPPMQRSFTVSGIFETGLPEFDESFALVDLRHIQKLNGWDSTLVGGIEILISDYDKIDEIGNIVNHSIGFQLKAETVKQIYPQLFEWIALFDTNVLVLMIITIFICMITMISTFFIIVLEQTPTIGILKTLGMKTRDVIPVFLAIASGILFRGLVIGNLFAIVLCLLQQHFHFIKLDAATYYVDYIPIELNPFAILGINFGILLVCFIVLIFPAYYIAKKISPINAIRFD